MKVDIRMNGWRLSESVSDISSLLLYDQMGIPTLLGLEYSMAEGTAWTFASENEKDFSKILATSGILRTFVPGPVPGSANLLCSPMLRKGVPRWFRDVEAFTVSTAKGIPFFLAQNHGAGGFDCLFHHAPQFKERLGEIWNRRR